MYEGPSKTQKAVVLIGIILLVVALVVAATWLVTRSDDESAPASDHASTSPADLVREEHAIELANRLFTNALVLKRSIPSGQAGLDQIATDRDGNIATDPTTNKPYVYVEDQSTMEVGEAHFRTGASCDNKTVGSDGEGLVVDSIENSVAITIKLESGGYACQSSL